MDVGTPTDRPNSVRNRCVIEFFCGVVYVVTLCLFNISVGEGAFVIGLSQIFSFFLCSFWVKIFFDFKLFSHFETSLCSNC